MDTYPITARSPGLYFKVDGNNLERAYKDHLSGFRNWEQASHAEDWVLHPKNIGKRLGIDETMLHKDLMTFLTNKEGHGKRHTLIAAVKGTKASDIINVLMQIPQEQREQVEEVTMDFSDSMFAVVTEAFPNAAIVIDCFHIVKRCIEAVEELRLKARREAQKAQNKEKAMFKKKLEQLVKSRKYYRKKHPVCTLREVKAARDAIKYKEEEVLNYFINRSTNAHAESLNSKLKGFRAQLRGVQDLPFFMFRASIIFG